MGIEGPLEAPREYFRPVYQALKDFQTAAPPPPAPLSDRGRLTLDPLPSRAKAGASLVVSGAIAGPGPRPAAVRVGVHGHDGWNPGRTAEAAVGPDGRFRAAFTVLPTDRILTVAAAAGDDLWDAAHVEISTSGEN